MHQGHGRCHALGTVQFSETVFAYRQCAVRYALSTIWCTWLMCTSPGRDAGTIATTIANTANSRFRFNFVLVLFLGKGQALRFGDNFIARYAKPAFSQKVAKALSCGMYRHSGQYGYLSLTVPRARFGPIRTL